MSIRAFVIGGLALYCVCSTLLAAEAAGIDVWPGKAPRRNERDRPGGASGRRRPNNGRVHD